MICRHFYLQDPDNEAGEWTPPALRETVCLLRKSNPEKWNMKLAAEGVIIEKDDICCLRNTDGNWKECPLYVERAQNQEAPKTNQYGFPLII